MSVTFSLYGACDLAIDHLLDHPGKVGNYLSLSTGGVRRLQFQPDDWLGRWITGVANRNARITMISHTADGSVPLLRLNPGKGWLAPLLKLRRPTMVSELPAVPSELAAGPTGHADLDKAWEGIHYLLTGYTLEGPEPPDPADPSFWLLCGGTVMGDEDIGYGPGRALKSDAVAAWHKSLKTWDEARLRARFNPTDMTEKGVWPAIWERDPEEDDTLGYLLEHFEILVQFLGERVEAGDGVILAFE